jgi:hypothetical protein
MIGKDWRTAEFISILKARDQPVREHKAVFEVDFPISSTAWLFSLSKMSACRNIFVSMRWKRAPLVAYIYIKPVV